MMPLMVDYVLQNPLESFVTNPQVPQYSLVPQTGQVVKVGAVHDFSHANPLLCPVVEPCIIQVEPRKNVFLLLVGDAVINFP